MIINLCNRSTNDMTIQFEKCSQLKGLDSVSSSWRKHTAQRENSFDISLTCRSQQLILCYGGNDTLHVFDAINRMHLKQMSCFERQLNTSAVLTVVACCWSGWRSCEVFGSETFPFLQGRRSFFPPTLLAIHCDSQTNAVRVEQLELIVFIPLPHSALCLSTSKLFLI